MRGAARLCRQASTPSNPLSLACAFSAEQCALSRCLFNTPLRALPNRAFDSSALLVGNWQCGVFFLAGDSEVARQERARLRRDRARDPREARLRFSGDLPPTKSNMRFTYRSD
eukprot:5691400-Pleurochrysis_carterae.AAC.2